MFLSRRNEDNPFETFRSDRGFEGYSKRLNVGVDIYVKPMRRLDKWLSLPKVETHPGSCPFPRNL